MKSDLLVKQDALQKEAQEVLEKLDLLKLLSKYGKPEVVGSMSLGLMTWRDIDIEVISGSPNKNDLAEMSSTLMRQTDERIDLTLIDNNNQEQAFLPKGLYFGIKYYGNFPPEEKMSSKSKYIWKIDLWFVGKEDRRGFIKTQELQKALTEEKIKIILEIKNALWDHPLYRKEIKSMDIYGAVLEKGVKNLEEFKKYLKDKNIILAGA